MTKNVVILRAGGRDFHNFLTFFKRERRYRVVAFTAEQIPGIAGRSFPAELAGKRYLRDIPISCYPKTRTARKLSNSKKLQGLLSPQGSSGVAAPNSCPVSLALENSRFLNL